MATLPCLDEVVSANAQSHQRHDDQGHGQGSQATQLTVSLNPLKVIEFRKVNQRGNQQAN
jgi:hypothetical protein